MSNFWLNKKKEREDLKLQIMAENPNILGVPAPATKTIPLWNFEEVIKAVLDKHTFFVSRPDVIAFGPSGPTIVEICQAECNPESNVSISSWELDL